MIRRTVFCAVLVAGAVMPSAFAQTTKESRGAERAEAKAAKEEKQAGASKNEPLAIKIDPRLGILEGKVALKGDPPKFPKPVEVPANHEQQAFCVQHVIDERLILGKGKELKNVVVSIEGYKPTAKPKPRPCRLDNRNCLFIPHVQATTVGSTLEITNGDSFIHNTRGLLRPVDRINTAIPAHGKVKGKKLRRTGWGVFKCDFHPWMMAHIHVFPHDLFAVTTKDGKFKIVNIPPGTHKVRLWHESLQKKTLKVEIEAGETTRLEESLEPYED